MQEINGLLGGKIKAFIDGVEFEESAQKQVHNIAGLKIIHEHVAIMPDVHMGYGATVGSVIPTKAAIIPSAVGVDIGCGMMAIRTSLTSLDLPENVDSLRSDIERAIPHGGVGPNAGWGGRSGIPAGVMSRWRDPVLKLDTRFAALVDRYPMFEKTNNVIHLGSLGTGNHFIELCLDLEDRVWVMLHSGSRGVGNFIGTHFIEKARNKFGGHLPDKDLAWFNEGTQDFDDYVEAVGWGQDFARQNREAMMDRVLRIMRDHFKGFTTDKEAVNCHHNYVEKEHHFGADVWLTRKGAVSAKKGELGIIPGSMGAKSYIVRGKGNADSFCSCSHGAGRRMSRGEARRTFTVEDQIEQTAGVNCRKDVNVIDEIPGAYKDIDAVMAAQTDLVEVVAQLKQFLCVKG